MATQLVNVKGHYPKGYPRFGGAAGSSSYDPGAMEKATDKPDLQTFKTAVDDAQNSTIASDYFTRNLYAREWWYSRWDYQTVDARKWGDPRTGILPWPWPGASDTRVRTCEKVIGQHRTIATYAMRNMKVQCKSTRPAQTIRESQQATTLLNWMLFTHMQAELHRELRLATAWRNGYGASILNVDWKQTRRLDYIDVNVMGLQEFVNEPAVAAFIGGNASDSQIPIGENLNITDLQEMIMDPSYEDDLAKLLVTVSHNFLSLRQAHSKLEDLREIRTVEIPIPYVFESRPRWTALRPMVDVLFPAYADDLQRVPWYDQIEFVSETELRDREETAGYTKAFIDEAVEHRGPSSAGDWRLTTSAERAAVTGVGQSSMDNDIELHHFYTLVQDRGVPVRFCTVFHMDVDFEAKHEPAGYDHGEACVHPLRFEIDDRPILSSRGIAEIAYSWEQELKTQYDAQGDRTSISLRPPLLTTYDQVQKMKESIQPGVVIPMRKFDEAEWLKMPPYDQVSILIIQEVEKRIREHFALFGEDVDPDLKKLRREEFVDDVLLELKVPIQQTMKLMRQLLPDDEVAQVVGPLNRPFHIGRAEIQGEWEISATVDLRSLDADFLKEKLSFLSQLAQLDTMGLLDKTALLKAGAESIDYSFADMAIQNPQVASQAEIQDEQRAVDLIIGSGQDQPLPQGANYALRLQTLQAKQQSITTNPATVQIIQNNPKIMEVLMNRSQYFQRQLQQQQNAQIGRMQVTQTFSKDAPQISQPQSAAMDQGGGGEGGMPGPLAALMAGGGGGGGVGMGGY
jgi:hypothetical protein